MKRGNWVLFVVILFLFFLFVPVITAFNDKLNYQKESGEVVIEYTRNPSVHQYLSYQAYLLLNGKIKNEFDNYIGSDSQCVPDGCGSENIGSTITEGSFEEDQFGMWLHHFWNPDTNDSLCLPIGFCYQSAYERAQYLYNLSIYYYINENNTELSYYYLGRVAHLLEDMSVPAHVHLDAHWGPYGDDSYEDYMAVHFREYNASSLFGESPEQQSGYGVFESNSFNTKSLFQDIFKESSKSSSLNSEPVISINNSLFSLFYDMAELADDFDSDDVCGEVDGCSRIWRCDILGYCDIDDANISEIGSVLMPSAIKHVAGLYRLFWLDTHKEEYKSCGQEGDEIDENHICCNSALKIASKECLNSLECNVDLDCGTDYCEDWNENYCSLENGNVYHNKSCYSPRCSDYNCKKDSFVEEELVEECGNGCLNEGCVEKGLFVTSPTEMVNFSRRVPIEVRISNGERVDRITYADLEDSNREKGLCRNCNGFKGSRRFSEGFHRVVFRAYNNGEIIDEKEVSFYVDSVSPRIYRTLPRRNSFVDEETEFSIEFKEENLIMARLYYGMNGNIKVKEIKEEDCRETRWSRTLCSAVIDYEDLKEFNGKRINYWFRIKDIAGHKSESSRVRVRIRV